MACADCPHSAQRGRWFAIVDVVGVLTDSVPPEGCVKDLRQHRGPAPHDPVHPIPQGRATFGITPSEHSQPKQPPGHSTFTGRGGKRLDTTKAIKNQGDFDLITWLVIK